MFVCIDHYIERCKELSQDDLVFPPYNPIQPEHHIHIYTDGSCEGNPGPAGYGVVMVAHDKAGDLIKQRHVAIGIGSSATNNQAELGGAIKALKLLNANVVNEPTLVYLYSDSEYLVKGMNSHIYSWMKNNWRTSQKKDVKNKELWMELWEASCDLNHRAQFRWVRGHSTSDANHSRYNGIAHELARSAAASQQPVDRIIAA